MAEMLWAGGEVSTACYRCEGVVVFCQLSGSEQLTRSWVSLCPAVFGRVSTHSFGAVRPAIFSVLSQDLSGHVSPTFTFKSHLCNRDQAVLLPLLLLILGCDLMWFLWILMTATGRETMGWLRKSGSLCSWPRLCCCQELSRQLKFTILLRLHKTGLLQSPPPPHPCSVCLLCSLAEIAH